MGLTVCQLPRLSDGFVNSSWVMNIDISKQDGVQQDDFVGEKLDDLKTGQILDHIDISKAIPLDPQFGKNTKYDLNNSFVVKGQQDFVEFLDGDVSEKAQKLSAQMTEYPVDVEFSMDGLSMGQIADLVGNIGKEVDNAFAAGEISEQEYSDLNKSLDTYADFMAGKAEKQKASFAVMKQTAAATKAKIESGTSDKEMTDYSELVSEKWQEKISEYLEENAFDRTTLNQMIAAIRTGQMPFFQTLG